MSLKIHLLGQFKLQANNLPIELPSRVAQSLLAYLALNADVTNRREKLAGLLWPEATDTNARNYLRQSLWRIHKSLESGPLSWEDFLQISDISVTFDYQGRVTFITGEARSGNCNAHTGIGDPYLPLREVLKLLTGDVEARYTAGAITSCDP